MPRNILTVSGYISNIDIHVRHPDKTKNAADQYALIETIERLKFSSKQFDAELSQNDLLFESELSVGWATQPCNAPSGLIILPDWFIGLL